MKCDFEEKQFEQHLNHELMGINHILYVPGQVFEGILGFDAAIFSNHNIFWKYFYPDRNGCLNGIEIDKRWWEEIDQHLEHFPKFKYNLFIQHKRPEYLTYKNSSEWKYWKQKYFRFRIIPHQQQSLEQLEEQIGTQGIVVYSCPAFHKFHSLWQNIKDRKFI